MRRRLAALVVALALAAAPSAHAADNTAVAVNTKDGSSLFTFSFNVARVMTDTVDTSNAAAAVASCTDCQTVAIALQFVLVMSEPDVFTPENVALAINIECSLCDTMASAYQFIIQVDGPVRLTPEGMKRLQEIRRELAALEDSGLSGPEMAARVDALAEEAYLVVTSSLVPAGQSDPSAEAPASTPTTAGSDEPAATTTTTEPEPEPESTTTTATTEPPSP